MTSHILGYSENSLVQKTESKTEYGEKEKRKIEDLVILRLDTPLAIHLPLSPPFKPIMARKALPRFQLISDFDRKYNNVYRFQGESSLMFSQIPCSLAGGHDLSVFWQSSHNEVFVLHIHVKGTMLHAHASYVPEIPPGNIAGEPKENQLIFWSAVDSLKLQMMQYITSNSSV